MLLDGVAAAAGFRREAVVQNSVEDEGVQRETSGGEGVGCTVDLDGSPLTSRPPMRGCT